MIFNLLVFFFDLFLILANVLVVPQTFFWCEENYLEEAKCRHLPITTGRERNARLLKGKEVEVRVAKKAKCNHWPLNSYSFYLPHAVFFCQKLALKLFLLVLWLKSLTLVFLLPSELFEEGKVSEAVNQSHVFEEGEIVEVEI